MVTQNGKREINTMERYNIQQQKRNKGGNKRIDLHFHMKNGINHEEKRRHWAQPMWDVYRIQQIIAPNRIEIADEFQMFHCWRENSNLNWCHLKFDDQFELQIFLMGCFRFCDNLINCLSFSFYNSFLSFGLINITVNKLRADWLYVLSWLTPVLLLSSSSSLLLILLVSLFIAPNNVSSGVVSKQTRIFRIVRVEPTLILAHGDDLMMMMILKVNNKRIGKGW